MPLLYLLILAIVQGITEFLPISSSGHLMLVHHWFKDAQSPDLWTRHLVMDVAVHMGTLLSVLLYFRRDVRAMAGGVFHALKGDFTTEHTRLGLHLIVASIPVILAGLALHILEPDWLLAVEIIAWTTLIFGIVLWFADRTPEDKNLRAMGLRDALIIGLAQSLALVPGTSRSGITMTASRFLGYTRTASARFSILLAIIAIAGAGTLTFLDLLQTEGAARYTFDAILAGLLSFGFGWVAINLMMRWLENRSFLPFVIYRIGLGLALLFFVYSAG